MKVYGLRSEMTWFDSGRDSRKVQVGAPRESLPLTARNPAFQISALYRGQGISENTKGGVLAGRSALSLADRPSGHVPVRRAPADPQLLGYGAH